MFINSPSIVKSAQQGVVLVEAMVAILIFSIGVLGIVGMQANMVKNTAESKYRADAAIFAKQRIGLMWADPSNLAAYVETDKDISAVLPNGKMTVTQPTTGQFVIEVRWQQPGEVAHKYTVVAYIVGG